MITHAIDLFIVVMSLCTAGAGAFAPNPTQYLCRWDVTVRSLKAIRHARIEIIFVLLELFFAMWYVNGIEKQVVIFFRRNFGPNLQNGLFRHFLFYGISWLNLFSISFVLTNCNLIFIKSGSNSAYNKVITPCMCFSFPTKIHDTIFSLGG